MIQRFGYVYAVAIGVELDNMYILNEWNLLSMLLSVGSVLIFGMWLAGKRQEVHWGENHIPLFLCHFIFTSILQRFGY